MATKYCDRCDSKVSYKSVSPGYFAVCLTHDEDLFEIETYEKGK